MAEKKTIQFNQSSFNGNNKTKKNKESLKKEKLTNIIKPNKLKKDLLEKIKKHQQEQKISKSTNNEKIPECKQEKSDFHHDFINSLEYLNKISNKNKSEKHKNKSEKHKNKSEKHKTLKNHLTGGYSKLHSQIQPIQNDPIISIDLPTDFDDYEPINKSPVIHLSNVVNKSSISDNPIIYSHPATNSNTNVCNSIKNTSIKIESDPQYGCLKGGSKPTYRMYNKTIKNNHIKTPRDNINNQNNLAGLKHKYKKMRQKSKKTTKSRYNLGRSLKNGKMSILVKNNVTRRKIKQEHCLLKQKPIGEIKKYLYQRNLLKIGSIAPNDIIRTLYEQSVLAGEINNHSKNISLHNFISDK
jgi:hypothetical protein